MAQDGKCNKGAIITYCDCQNEYQDKTYGKGKRVKNACSKGHRCTGCNKVE